MAKEIIHFLIQSRFFFFFDMQDFDLFWIHLILSGMPLPCTSSLLVICREFPIQFVSLLYVTDLPSCTESSEGLPWLIIKPGMAFLFEWPCLSVFFAPHVPTACTFIEIGFMLIISSVQFSHSVVSNPMDCRTPGFPVHHQLPKLAQTQVHHVGDAIQPSHPLSPLLSPSIFPASGSFQVSQFFASGGQSMGISASASILSMNIQD